ncbi:uncharacterized protein LOC133203949 isoform X2 [Saccostrea echinata]|uniref:uncharacterized protein LOC133203949 isoform X2 n=1 Tax=Saccostrea echinata TaxID=191078 RepID=UPI002A7FE7DF|nr:uncharacterized protein LOC133203949 isoform X2 [Saccostrea echinata]
MPLAVSDKDSKMSWIVCAVVVVVQMLIPSLLFVFGVFFIVFIREYNTSRANVAWIGSVAYGLSMTFGPVASILVNRFGHRVVMIAGGLLCAVAVFLSSFVTHLNQMFGSFSVLYGIGTCMSVSPTMTIAPKFFDKHMTLAVGLMTAGSSIGTLIMAPVSQTLIDAIGWRNTFRCFSGTCLFSAICCCLIRPLPSSEQETPLESIKQSPARKLMQELKLWKNRVFVVWTCAVTCVMFGYYIPYVHLVSYAQDIGIPPEKGSMLIMVLGITTAIGRVMFGKIVGLGVLNRLHMHQLSMVVTGTAVMMLPMIRSFIGIIFYVVVVGLVDGCYVVLLPVLTVSLMAGENSVTAWGFLIGTSSVTFTLGPPVAGALFDALGSYNVAFHCAGIPVITGAIILFFIPWAQRTSRSENAMVVVSDMECSDQEQYDFADDLIDEARRVQERRSKSVGKDGTIDIDQIQLHFPAGGKSRSRRFRDQGTSTLPDNIQYVPQDLKEAITMLQENARLISEMLANGNPQSKAEAAQNERWGAKSRSEMVQPTVMDIQPQKMISIMSIPGGLTISHWEPRAPNATDSISNPPSMFSSQSFLQNAQSFHSRNLSEYIVSPGAQGHSPIQQNSGIATSPKEMALGMQAHSPIQQSTGIPTSPKDIAMGQQATSPLQQNIGIITSPQERATGSQTHSPMQRNIIKLPQERNDTPCINIPSISPQQNTRAVADLLDKSNISNVPVDTSEIHSDQMDSAMAFTKKVLSPTSPPQILSQQEPSTSGPSPRATIRSPVLCAIPEVTIGQPINQPKAEVRTDNLTADDTDKWTDNSPNDPKPFMKQNSGEEISIHSDTQTSSGAAIQSDSSLSVKESVSVASAGEIDVFTHLFDDHDEPTV